MNTRTYDTRFCLCCDAAAAAAAAARTPTSKHSRIQKIPTAQVFLSTINTYTIHTQTTLPPFFIFRPINYRLEKFKAFDEKKQKITSPHLRYWHSQLHSELHEVVTPRDHLLERGRRVVVRAKTCAAGRKKQEPIITQQHQRHQQHQQLLVVLRSCVQGAEGGCSDTVL